MSIMGFVLFTAFFLATTLNRADALKCWRCSSDAKNASFCGDPFDPNMLTTRSWSYVECNPPPGTQSGIATRTRAACKKLKQHLYEKNTVISRSCVWEDVNSPTDKCMSDVTPSYIETQFCETCTTDGCNAAPGFGPIIALVAIPSIAIILSR